MSSGKRLWVAGLVTAALAAACGGGEAARPAATARSAPPSEDATQNDAPSAATAGTGQAAPTHDGDPGSHPTLPAPPPTIHPPVSPMNTAQPSNLDAQRSWALATLGDSEHQIDATVKECATACRALASMERAAKTLCDLGDPGECARAKARVEAARDKVKKSCGRCENGPSLVPGAPIPSQP
jgi:hypothetical protein